MPRVQAGQVAEILGVTKRTVLNLANRGELPSAAKIGRVWTFDEQRIREYLAEREIAVEERRRDREGAAAKREQPKSERPPSQRDIDRAYEIAMSKLLGRPIKARKS
jgi:excisionase family DNA binding protein